MGKEREEKDMDGTKNKNKPDWDPVIDGSGSTAESPVIGDKDKKRSKEDKKKEKEEKKKEAAKKKEEKKLEAAKKKEEKKRRNTVATTPSVPQVLPPMPQANELDTMFAQLLEDLDVPIDKREEMTRVYSAQMKWTFINEHKFKVEATAKIISDTGATTATIKDSPQYFVNKLKIEPDTDTLTSLAVSLRGEPLIWLNTFRQLHGLQTLLKIISDTEKKFNKSKREKEMLLQAILCIKALMNNGGGLQELMDTKDSLNSIALCLDTNSPKLKIVIYEMFASICFLHGQTGHSAALEAMTHYKVVKREPVRFSHLVDSLRFEKMNTEHEKQMTDMWMSCLTFINCLINLPEQLAERLEIRSEFLQLGLAELIADIKKEQNKELEAQIKSFEEDLAADEDEFKESVINKRKLNLDDMHEVFSFLAETVKTVTYLKRPLHSILRGLLSFPVDSEQGIRYWVLAEKFIQQLAFQKDHIKLNPTEKGTHLEKLLSLAEDKAELELYREKFEDLQQVLDDERTSRAKKLKARDEEIQKLKLKVEKWKKKFEEKAVPQEMQEQMELVRSLKEEKDRIEVQLENAKKADDDSTSPPPPPPPPGDNSDSSDAAPPPPPPPLPGGSNSGDVPPPLPPSAPPPPGGPPPPPGAPSMSTPAAMLPKLNVPKPSVPMKNFNWSKLPNTKVSNTIFMDTFKEEDVLLDYQEIESLFCQKIIERKVAEKISKPPKVNLVDPRRSQNIGIFLSTIKLSAKEIKDVILNLDEKHLDLETTSRLLENTPTAEEITAIKTYLEKGEYERLGDVEKFFVEIETIPSLQARLRCLVYLLFFPVKLEELKPDLSKIKDASKELRRSKKFLKVIQIVLTLGNFLNGGTARGAAFGFKLNALLKLSDTKTTDNKSSLLHYLIKIMTTKYAKLDLVSFTDEITTVEEAKRVSLQTLQAELSNLKKKLVEAENDLKTISKLEGIDIFSTIVPKRVKRCRAEFEDFEKLFEETSKEYRKTAELFGENPTVMQPEQFFDTLSQFIFMFQKTWKQMQEQQIKEEKAKKRAIEAEQKRLKEAERKKQKALAKEQQKKESKKDEEGKGIMDSALAQLRGGELFNIKRRERRSRKYDESAMMSSIMGTLANLTTEDGRQLEKKKQEAAKARQQEDEEHQRQLEERRKKREEARAAREAEAQAKEQEEEQKRLERRRRLEQLRNT